MTSRVLSAIQHYPEKPALVSEDVTLTYAALAEEVERLVQCLHGQRAVAICMENSPAWVVADLGCLAAGVACVPLPPFFTDGQIAHALTSAGVSLVLTDQPRRFQGEAKQLKVAGKTIHAVPQQNDAVHFPQNTAKITYTSGTTGTPKGVCLTQPAMETVAQSLLQTLGADIAARHVCLLPLAVLLENVAGVYTALLAGATCYLPPVCHEPQALADAIVSVNATSCILVPELLRMLLATECGFPSLKFAAVGGARVDPMLLEAARARSIAVYEGYGLSEACSVVALNTPGNHRSGTVGQLLPHVEVKISDGEILLKDPLFSGYLGEGGHTGEWYATGDLGSIDEDSFLRIEGRKRNVFITSFGRNVSPEWPESALTTHPAILQAAVFGEARPHAVAVIVPRSVADIPAGLSQVNARLPDYARIGAYVLAKPFTVENGQLTGTGRVRREVIFAAYKNQIEACYSMEKTA